MLWLIAAGLILGIGSVYWTGLSKRLEKMPDPGEQTSEQISLAGGSSPGVLPATITVGETPEISTTATQASNRSMISPSTQTASNVENREADIQALTALYQQTGGSNWENADG